MEKIFTDFGVDPLLISAQAVNFLVLFYILKRFLFRPLLKIIEERQKVVQDSLDNADKIEQRLQTVESESAERLDVVSKKAQKIIDNATLAADVIIEKAHKKAESDIEKMIVDAQRHIAEERKTMQKELHQELAKLVIFGIEKTSSKIVDDEDHKKLIAQQCDELSMEKSG